MRSFGSRASVMGLVFGSLTLLVAAPAIAHVRVAPVESKPGVTETYKVTVPTEGKVPTVRVELVVPEGIELVSVAEAADPHDVRKGDAGTSIVTWRGEILPGWAREYFFTAHNPQTGSRISWQAHQFFADGAIADWVDVPGSKRPASVAKLTDHRAEYTESAPVVTIFVLPRGAGSLHSGNRCFGDVPALHNSEACTAHRGRN